jgi:hypothetical protein
MSRSSVYVVDEEPIESRFGYLDVQGIYFEPK